MQAISLDKLRRQVELGEYESHSDDHDADCVIAFSFGFRKVGNRIEPGESNQDIASFIYKLYFRLPKIVQREIAEALPKEVYPVGVHIIEKHREAGKYLDSREVAAQAKATMDSRGWEKAIIVAHAYHMPRVDAVCRKLGIETVVPGGLGSIRFDPESDQEWTRNALSWAEREAEAIDYYAEKGWI